MGLVVFTGGARSGKSRAAEAMTERCVGAVDVAVFGSGLDDPEMQRRIERHKADRDDSWNVIEARDSVEWTERVKGDVLLLDCLGTLLSMVMAETATDLGGFPEDPRALPEGFEAEVEKRFAALVGWLVRREQHTVVVTNEVGGGVVPGYPSGRVFRDVLGRGNRALVDRAERAYVVIAGRLIDLLALPVEGVWPWHEKGCD